MTDVRNSEDIIDSRDVIARIEELTEKRAPWAAGWNMPGYMPDSEPTAFADWESARDYIVSEMERSADDIEEQDDADGSALRDAAVRLAALPDESEVGETVGAYHWWVSFQGPNAGLDDEEAEELTNLEDLAKQAEGYGDWEYGETLIRDSYFAEYAEELAEDIGAINKSAAWPLTYIDWDAAAEALKQDYTSIEFDGVTYWMRS